MTKRGWWISGVVLALAFAGLLAWRWWTLPIHVAAPEPSPTADFADTLSQVPPSFLIAPIAFDLGPAIAQFEADVPRRFGSLDRRIRADSNARASVAFAARRSPFRVHVHGSEIVIEAVVEYEARAWYNPALGPEVSVGCGGGNKPNPRLLMRVTSTPSLTPQWGLRTRTHSDVVRFSDESRDRCQVSFLKIDVTGKVVDVVRGEMTLLLAKFDRDVARLDTRDPMANIWKEMERPIRLTDGVWMLIQPSAAQLMSLSGAGDTLVAVVRLEARPKIVTGVRPQDSILTPSLPPLQTMTDAGPDAATATGLHLVLEGVFSYDAATHLMRKALVGKVITMAGRRMRVEEVTMSGIGSGRVALGVTLSGAVQGRIFFTGTPRLNLETRQLTVPDLDFDVGSADLFARGLSWWHGDSVRDLLRAMAAIPDSAALAEVERLAQQGMNRELTSGVRLEATLNGARGLSVRATREHLVVRALAEGQARLAINRVLARASTRSPARPLPSH